MPEKLNDEEKRMLTRRYFRSESMRRYLRSLPIFATERWLPEPMRTLLKRIDAAERKKK
jgi:hypothetical protein